jgi:Asp/Glu/hydantoin racemase
MVLALDLMHAVAVMGIMEASVRLGTAMPICLTIPTFVTLMEHVYSQTLVNVMLATRTQNVICGDVIIY